MEFIGDPALKPGGLTYAELARNFLELKTQFDGYVLPIMSILTDDTEFIEDMFSRLNEAVPLNAPEKRNALGGPIPRAVRDLAKHKHQSILLSCYNMTLDECNRSEPSKLKRSCAIWPEPRP